MSEPIIQLTNVEKSFKTGALQNWVLRRINLEIMQGEFVTIMGPSGAGKSTLLSIIGLLDDEWRGEYFLGDQPIHKLSRKQKTELNKRSIGFVFQSYHLLDTLTVAENIDLPLSYSDVKKSERSARVADILDRFHIVAKKDLYPSQLSGGQQQLVGIARAVVNNPEVLLADEPTGNLHSDQARSIMELFRQLNERGTTVIQVTHSDANAAYGSRTIRLFDGWIDSDTAAKQVSSIGMK
jgi:putative ABC transport system ATP-binding protein